MRLAVAAVCLALASGCVRGVPADDGRVRVVSGVYPLTFVAQRVGETHVAVTDLAAPGAEPHDLELTPAQIGAIEQADLVLLVHGLQPALDDATPGETGLDGALDGSADPHVWLNPMVLAGYADRVAARLAAADPANATVYTTNAAALRVDLTILDAAITRGLRTCARRDLVVEHAAFGHFAARYRLRQTAIAGVDPEAEPSPRRLADVTAYVKAHHVTTVFAERADSRTARTVAREARATVAVLDPVERHVAGDYLSAMRGNLVALRSALGCS